VLPEIKVTKSMILKELDGNFIDLIRKIISLMPRVCGSNYLGAPVEREGSDSIL